MQGKFRHEYKHAINLCDYYCLKPKLSSVMKRDGNVNADGTYTITSLYFDTPYDKALREKIDGVSRREKFRIRFYNDDFSFIKLEKKSKVNGLCLKNSSFITKEECEKIFCGDIGWMCGSERELIQELYAKINYQLLRPKTIVKYIREPFVYKAGNVRVTVDSDIRTGLFSTDVFNKDTPLIKTQNPEFVLLEVKYDEFLPDIIADIVQLGNRKAAAFSKYQQCRKFY